MTLTNQDWAFINATYVSGTTKQKVYAYSIKERIIQGARHYGDEKSKQSLFKQSIKNAVIKNVMMEYWKLLKEGETMNRSMDEIEAYLSHLMKQCYQIYDQPNCLSLILNKVKHPELLINFRSEHSRAGWIQLFISYKLREFVGLPFEADLYYVSYA